MMATETGITGVRSVHFGLPDRERRVDLQSQPHH